MNWIYPTLLMRVDREADEYEVMTVQVTEREKALVVFRGAVDARRCQVLNASHLADERFGPVNVGPEEISAILEDQCWRWICYVGDLWTGGNERGAALFLAEDFVEMLRMCQER